MDNGMGSIHSEETCAISSVSEVGILGANSDSLVSPEQETLHNAFAKEAFTSSNENHWSMFSPHFRK